MGGERVNPEYGRKLPPAEEGGLIYMPVFSGSQELPLQRVISQRVADGHGEKKNQHSTQPTNCNLSGSEFRNHARIGAGLGLPEFPEDLHALVIRELIVHVPDTAAHHGDNS